MSSSFSHIENKLHLFKVHSIKVKLIKSSIIWLTLVIALAVLISITEWLADLSVFNRTLFVSIYLLFFIVSAIVLIIKPIIQIIHVNKSIKDKDAANIIGKFFPIISDKLLNYLELKHSFNKHNPLVKASLNQRAPKLNNIEFIKAVDTTSTKKTLNIFIPLIILIAILLFIAPHEFVSSTTRVINFRKEYIPKAPFSFQIISNHKAYRYEDYTLSIKIVGEKIPTEAYLVDHGTKIKMSENQQGSFSTVFSQIKNSKSFFIESSGYKSKTFKLNVIARPSMNSLYAKLKYPTYLHIKEELINPVGELEIPEGTSISWTIEAKNTKNVNFYFNSDTIRATYTAKNKYTVNKIIKNNGFYGFILSNKQAKQKGEIEYNIATIKDQFPKIQVQSFVDTLLYKSILIGGNISDDYGVSNLLLIYQIEKEVKKTISLPFNKQASTQNIYVNWLLDSLSISSGQSLSYYLQVFDNDQVNGIKSTKSKTMYLKIPSKEMLEKKLAKREKAEKKFLHKTKNKAAELRKNINKAIESIRGKKKLSWKDKQNIKELLKERKKLNKKINELQKQNKLLNLQRDDVQKSSEKLYKKNQQLQKLMNELLNEETKKLYDELQKLLEEQAQADNVQSLLNKIQKQEINLEEELNRALELFKKLLVEKNLEKITKDLNDLAKKQNSLAKKTKNKKNKLEDLKEKQEKIAKEFKKIQNKIEETKAQNKKLKRPSLFEKTSGEENKIKETLSASEKNLKDKKRKKSSENQKKASGNMKKLANKLKQMQQSMQMDQMQENIHNLRAILENLITLSYTQEQVMVNFESINQSDPKYVVLSEQQLKIKDNSKIIKDSLLSLASRVMSISSFVTRELNELDNQLDKSASAIKNRTHTQAAGYQQLSMTSMNNLALMLDNILQQMQKNMANASGKGKKENGKPMPGMSELQKQLNKEISKLQKSGKSGKELSKELAKLAAKQEMIRQALRAAEKKFGNKPSEKNGKNPNNLKNLKKQMEKTELDLVNKNLTRDLQKRQKKILTRLLEAENALKEQEIDLKRESKSATQYEKKVPKAFEEYLKQKKTEIELIKTIPPKLHPYYKKEVKKYFNRLKK